MRILILNWRDLSHPAAGGAEVYTEQVLRRWAAAGHRVVLFAAAVNGKPATEIRDGYRVIRAGSRFTVYREARRWWQRHGRGNFDVVIDETNTVPFQAHEWVDDGTRTIALVHQTCEEIWHVNAPPLLAHLGRHRLEPNWLRRLGRSPILAVSESTRESLARFGAHDVTVVPEGYAPPDPLPRPAKETRPTAVFCGRMVPYKRPDDVIRAVGLARRRIPGLRLWMIGGGPLLDRLATRAPGYTDFLGRVPEAEKHELMARAHVHLAASVREGWGLVVTEAAALGTPTIAYDVPGLRDSTRAAAGAVVAPRPEAMAGLLTELLPGWLRQPPEPLPYGGALSWDEVAATLLTAVDRHARAPRHPVPVAA
ncbi:glycosyltransferase family 4 protein [Actinoplanes derwentensis]|uniref:Glycosyltransferase involved in cell wall bisynthesis n=1 Tax=Actinoplanes derwentensis TaxID=113562 RepID=A0A1H2AKY1_9ACTN|nr:glycosyltransferase family 4 protein [Actinoplanes derwentensis]GID88806.1 glycosyl transferase [Actinoplanes derwentensis]SDT46675.1 Glycosyltransferase involved in cell wall bisynthesis [Actinoplanes derwentensis]